MYALILIAFLQSGPEVAVEVFPTAQVCQVERARVIGELAGSQVAYSLECVLVRQGGTQG